MSSRRDRRSGTFGNGMEFLTWGSGPKALLFIPGGPGSAIPKGMTFRMSRRWFDPFVAAGYTIWFVTRRRNMPTGHTVSDMADEYALPGQRSRWIRRLVGPWIGRVLLSGKNYPPGDLLVELEAEMSYDSRPALPRIEGPVLSRMRRPRSVLSRPRRRGDRPTDPGLHLHPVRGPRPREGGHQQTRCARRPGLRQPEGLMNATIDVIGSSQRTLSAASEQIRETSRCTDACGGGRPGGP